MPKSRMTPEEQEAHRVARNKRQRQYNSLVRLGFTPKHWTGNGYRVSCTQCQALCINGVATHEQGCPNAKRPREEDED